MKFEVPVIGPDTIEVMQATKTTVLAVTSGLTRLLDRNELLKRANDAKIAIVGYKQEEGEG